MGEGWPRTRSSCIAKKEPIFDISRILTKPRVPSNAEHYSRYQISACWRFLAFDVMIFEGIFFVID
jgi:hypothetical protein